MAPDQTVAQAVNAACRLSSLPTLSAGHEGEQGASVALELSALDDAFVGHHALDPVQIHRMTPAVFAEARQLMGALMPALSQTG